VTALFVDDTTAYTASKIVTGHSNVLAAEDASNYAHVLAQA